MTILTLDQNKTISLTITSKTVRVNKNSSVLKRSFNKIYLKRWNSKKNVKILIKEFGEGTHDVPLYLIFDELIDNKKAAKKVAKKIVNEEFKKNVKTANKLAEDIEDEIEFNEIDIEISEDYTLTKELLTAIRKQAKCSSKLKIYKSGNNKISISMRKILVKSDAEKVEDENLDW